MNDRSILIAEITGSLGWEALLLHLELHPGLTIVRTDTDDVTEQWIDFTFRGGRFTIHQEPGSHSIFRNDPDGSPEITRAILDHLLSLPPV